MGGEQSRGLDPNAGVDELKKYAFNEVHVTDDVRRRLGKKSNISSNMLEINSEDDKQQTSRQESIDDKQQIGSIENEEVTRLREDLQRRNEQVERLQRKVADLNVNLELNRNYAIQKRRLESSALTLDKEDKNRQREIQERLAKELAQNIDTFEKRFVNSSILNNSICSDQESAVMKCYLNYSRNSLKCTKLADDFYTCVRNSTAGVK